jgi:hypothetical protein
MQMGTTALGIRHGVATVGLAHVISTEPRR